MKNLIWTINSRYAIVSCVKINGNLLVRKEIAPNNVNTTNAKWVNEASGYFREKLSVLNVPLATPYTFTEEGGKAIQECPYVGPDLEQVLKTKGVNSLGQKFLVELVESIKGVLVQDEPEVGIDARLSNFCIGPDGVVYVDTFPPLVKYKDEYIVHFPNPTDPQIRQQEFKRKFDSLGILRRLRFSILEQDAGYTEEDILDAIYTVMGNHFGDKVKKFFHSFLDHLDFEEALGQITLDDLDGIRELALKLMPPKGEERVKYLNDIFELSSNFCPIQISPEERIKRIRLIFEKQKVKVL